MKKYLCLVLIGFLGCGLFVSCTRDMDTARHIAEQSVASGVLDSDSVALDSLYVQPLTSESSVSGEWKLLGNYAFLYKHFCQLDASPEYPGSVLCGPTSYMIAAYMIASNKGRPYQCSKQKLGGIYTALRSAGKFDNRYGMYIQDIGWFCANYDYPVVQTSYMRTSRRDVIKGYLEHYMKEGDPVIVPVNIFGLQGAYWVNDKDPLSTLGTKYYIAKNGTVGHFILLTGLKLNDDGSGLVYYRDPLSRNGETRSVSYSRLLDAMLFNGNISFYDALAVFG